VAKPYARGLMIDRFKPGRMLTRARTEGLELARIVATMPYQVHDFLEEIRDGQIEVGFVHKGLDEFMQKLNVAFNRLVIALVVVCGTGRLLMPYFRAGLDVDGCDVSADMVELCRQKAAGEGLSPTLLVQPMHELDAPRSYRTIFVCGAFGLGSNREQDEEALRRLHDHLEPGGTLLLDIEVPYADSRQWRHWPREERAALPEARTPPRERRIASDGADL